MGGLFKDFWNDLAALAFDQRASRSSARRPTSCSARRPRRRSRTARPSTCGSSRSSGACWAREALRARVTVQPQFAHFFLSFMGGHYNYAPHVRRPRGLDAELHRNLMFLKARGAFSRPPPRGSGVVALA